MGLAALVLVGCGKGADQTSVPPATEARGALPTAIQAGPQTSISPRGIVVAAPTDVKAPPAGTVVPQASNAAAEAAADNAKVGDLAKQFEADPTAIARQNAACGPADQIVNNLYAVSHGAETDELHRFRIACMAKDAAQRELAGKAGGADGGVKNTNSL